jgi:putative ABC transport system permease protein
VSPTLLRAAARYHLHHPWQLALAVLGIALGVAVVIAVDLATASARRAFMLSTETVTGRATHEIVGGPAGVPDSLYVALRTAHGIDSIAPVVDRYVSLPEHGDRVLRLLGVDPFAEAPFRTFVGPAAGQLDVSALLTQRALLLEAGTAAQLGLTPGDRVLVDAGRTTVPAIIAAVLDPPDAASRRALADIALADIATAQEIAAHDALDRIELRVSGAAGEARLDRVRALLPAGTRVVEPATRVDAMLRMTRAFETNLTALALVALVFGMFLIYNSVTFSLVQRRPLIGLLRAQGVTAREISGMILVEVAVIGAVATMLGLAAGALLGTGLVRLVARTINDLYFTVSVTSAQAGADSFLKGIVLGMGATIAAALPPLREAVRTAPRPLMACSRLERQVTGRAGHLAGVAVVTATLGVAALVVPSRSITLGFAALFVLILAAALVTPAATIVLMAGVRRVATAAGAGPIAHMAARGVTSSLSRTAPAIAALSVAISVGIAVTIMIGSFRSGVITWLDRSLPADIYVAAPGIGADRTERILDPRLARVIASMPAVAGVSTYRHISLLVDDDIIRLIAADLYAPHRRAFDLLSGGAAAWRTFEDGGLLVSEPLAWRRGVEPGDSLSLPTDRGTVALPVAGVYRDYASEHGVVFIRRDAYDHLWRDDAITSIGVFAEAGSEPDAIEAAIRALPAAAGVVLRSNRGLRESTLVVFDRTFAITGVLRLLALLVAFVGVAGALMALQLERGREIGVLRATGLTPAQVWTLVTTQTGLMGLAAAVIATPLGLMMAWAMVHVINRRSFGWSFDMNVGAMPFAQALAVGIGAALIAGAYPAWRMSRIRPAEALREE